eukprot:TRINITY_DN54633_c0_g1_i1.p1 TRINITY_DN54633_c0_g1~~TRINITY_DN54633_c0_g1_i1.p1  ORF type:complete len:149 (+),score=14.65 TRINITY_DN54633_c0_g1_i1:33-449(+)
MPLSPSSIAVAQLECVGGQQLYTERMVKHYERLARPKPAVDSHMSQRQMGLASRLSRNRAAFPGAEELCNKAAERRSTRRARLGSASSLTRPTSASLAREAHMRQSRQSMASSTDRPSFCPAGPPSCEPWAHSKSRDH